MREREWILVGMTAWEQPRRLPGPVWRPLRRAARLRRTREREWILVGLRMIRPSLISLRTLNRELAIPISLTSFGSSQIRFLPHFLTAAAKRFWTERPAILKKTTFYTAFC